MHICLVVVVGYKGLKLCIFNHYITKAIFKFSTQQRDIIFTCVFRINFVFQGVVIVKDTSRLDEKKTTLKIYHIKHVKYPQQSLMQGKKLNDVKITYRNNLDMPHKHMRSYTSIILKMQKYGTLTNRKETSVLT